MLSDVSFPIFVFELENWWVSFPLLHGMQHFGSPSTKVATRIIKCPIFGIWTPVSISPVSHSDETEKKQNKIIVCVLVLHSVCRISKDVRLFGAHMVYYRIISIDAGGYLIRTINLKTANTTTNRNLKSETNRLPVSERRKNLIWLICSQKQQQSLC